MFKKNKEPKYRFFIKNMALQKVWNGQDWMDFNKDSIDFMLIFQTLEDANNEIKTKNLANAIPTIFVNPT